MSNELELLVPSKTKEISSNSKINQNSTKKDGESLFDQILSKAKSDIGESKKDNLTQSKDTPTDTKNSNPLKTENKDIKEVKTEISQNSDKTEKTIKNDNEKGEVKTTSLMDRLIQEAKTKAENKDVKTEVKIETSKSNDKSEKLLNDDNEKVELKNTTSADRFVQESKTKIENKDTKTELKAETSETNDKTEKVIKNDNEKGEVKTTTSMDRFIQESKTKTEIKDVKDEVKTETSEKIEKVTKNDNEKNGIKTTSSVDRFIEETKTKNVDKKENNDIKDEVKTDASEKKEKVEKNENEKVEVKTTSLMDRLIEESKTKNSENSDVKDELKNDISEKVEKVDKVTKNDNEKGEVKSTQSTDRFVQEIKTENKDIKVESKEAKTENKDIKVEKDLQNTKKDLDISLTNKNSGEIKNQSIDEKSNSQLNHKSNSLSNESSNTQKVQNLTNDDILDQTKQQVGSKDSTSEVKNQKVANKLSKLNSTNQELNISKEDTLSLKDSTKKSESLIDKILNENKKDVINPDKVKKESSTLEQLLKDTQNTNNTKSKDDFLTSIYMGNQKKTISDKNLEIKHEGVQIAKNATSTKDIENSAKVLNLGLEKVEVNVEKNVETKVETKLSSTFERLSIFQNSSNNSKDTKDDNSKKENNGFLVNGKTIKENEIDTKLVNLTVSPAASQTIQNRIIGARQQMASMMSDMARVMYENYNPPVTAFRINLNPSALGTIAIIIRNEQRNNSLSISMKASNSSTKESLVENQSALKESLFKSFAGSATSFDLDFDTSVGSNDSQDNENSENEDFRSAQAKVQGSTNTKESEVTEDSSYNYM